jgi:hypothetical protein
MAKPLLVPDGPGVFLYQIVYQLLNTRSLDPWSEFRGLNTPLTQREIIYPETDSRRCHASERSITGILARTQDPVLHQKDRDLVTLLREGGCRFFYKPCVSRFKWIS